MMESDDDFLALWRTTSAEVPADRSACLTEVEWARLLTKEADADGRARAADHIASCRECAEEYRLLQPLRLWAADVEQVFPSKDSARADGSMRWRGWWVWPRPSLATAGAVMLLVGLAAPLYFLVQSNRENAQLKTQLAQDKRDLSSAQTSLAAAEEEIRRRSPVQTAVPSSALQERLAQLQTQIAQGKEELSATRASLAAVQEELRHRPPLQTAEELNTLRQRLTQLQTQLAQGNEELLSTQTSLAVVQEELRRRPPMQIVQQFNALQQRLAQLSTPQLGVDIITLDRRDAGDGRGPADPTNVTINPDASLVALVLNFDPLRARSTLEVELIDDSGRTRWVGRAQRDRTTATLTLAVPTDDFPAGRYDIRVFRVPDRPVLPGRGVPASRLGPQPTRVSVATYPLILSGSGLTKGR